MSDEDEHGAEGLRLAEEIRLLTEMLVERAAPWLDGVISAGHGGDESHEAGAEGGSTCGWCPLCAIVAVVQGERPEFAARVLEQLAQLVALLRAVLADRWEPDEGVHMPGFRPAPRPAAASEAPAEGSRVQHIAVLKREDWRPEQES